MFKEKFVGFIDIIGFKSIIAAAENGTGKNFSEIEKLLQYLGHKEDRERYVKSGPRVCPIAPRINNDLDFRITQISDCVVVSSEVSPAGVINLIDHCWAAVLNLLTEGVMCRGYITHGSIYHTDSQFMGSAYQRAVEKEKWVSVFKREADERGTPFVEIDNTVCSYVENYGDACVKKMFSRYVHSDGVSTALFPFKRMAHQFPIIEVDFEVQKKSNSNLRNKLIEFKNKIMALVDEANLDAVKKAQHYVTALDIQLRICNETEEQLSKLQAMSKQH